MKQIAKALALFQKNVPMIPKNSTNPYFKSKYASLDSILTAIKEPLQTAGLAFTQIPTGENELTTTIYEVESGESITGTYKMVPVKNDPQGLGSVITYMRRYALVAMLGLNTDEDDDGNTASTPVKTSPKPKEKKPTQAEAYKAAEAKIMAAKTEADVSDFKKKLQLSTLLSEDQIKTLWKLAEDKLVEITQ